jgi:hypothetical protein
MIRSFVVSFVLAMSSVAMAVPAEGHRIMVTGPSPYSVQIVKDIHAHGGNVVDALVAAALELGVTHPITRLWAAADLRSSKWERRKPLSIFVRWRPLPPIPTLIKIKTRRRL